jgi:hypothetical protein
MDSRETNRDEQRRGLDREIDRYREAATSTLEQLEWVVGYLFTIRKPELARAVERNRRRISEGMR